MSYPTNFIHTADVHLGKRQYDLDERFRDFANAFLKIADYAVNEKAEFVLISGDLFEQRNINAPTYVQARQVLMRLKEAGIPCIAIEGNHDRAFLRDGMSWLESLDYEGLLKLIKPGEERLMENYVDIGRIRIYGMCYAGSSTSAVLPRIAQEIKEINGSDPPEYTVLMMHLGVEGKVKDSIIGEVSYESLLPLRECVDYLALGHYHNAYDIDGWVYNPGCPETWSIAELGGQKGFYHVKNGVAALKQVEGTREFFIVKVNVDGHKRVDTLEGEIEHKLSHISSNKPIVYVLLHGTLNFDRSAIDIEKIRRMAIERTGALYADVRFDLLNDEFTVARLDSDSLDRASIEREVFRKLALADSMLAGHSEQFARSLADIKDLAVKGADEHTLDAVLRKLFETIKGAPEGQENLISEGDGEWDWRNRL
ncbi:metallophosphoesterase family protein [Methanocella conradii]|uniref:metallophosphoesterase family protein n=1 Tax=Methanocella conradii TaxID=1175444 RepID=UPI00157BDBFC|nr:DNA repair exonuclease [Methanocella conradii]